MGTLAFAALGGLISFLSTLLGSLLSQSRWKAKGFSKFKLSIDFALGLMMSAVAFSLVMPATQQTFEHPGLFWSSLGGFALGGLAILVLKFVIDHSQNENTIPSSKLLMALALIIHNFPEGMASGAALAGLELKAAIPLLSSISLQNIPEGLLMVVTLKALGWSNRYAFLGGVFSGVVEWLGALSAGVALSWTQDSLPFILMLAGGAMMISVLVELKERGASLKILLKPEFALGLALIPLLNLAINI